MQLNSQSHACTYRSNANIFFGIAGIQQKHTAFDPPNTHYIFCMYIIELIEILQKTRESSILYLHIRIARGFYNL